MYDLGMEMIEASDHLAEMLELAAMEREEIAAALAENEPADGTQSAEMEAE